MALVWAEWNQEFSVIGGTVALQINHRLSEDVDFCKWKKAKMIEPLIISV